MSSVYQNPSCLRELGLLIWMAVLIYIHLSVWKYDLILQNQYVRFVLLGCLMCLSDIFKLQKLQKEKVKNQVALHSELLKFE